LLNIFQLLGVDTLDIDKAQGINLYTKEGKIITDFTSALGVMSMGHNHPRIVSAISEYQNRMRPEAIKVGPMALQGALAYNLAQLLPGPLEICNFSVSGAEAIESAIKLCSRAQGNERNKFVTCSGSYHGRTSGTLTLSRSGNFQEGFILSIPQDQVIVIPYDDISSIEKSIESNTKNGKCEIAAIFLEPIQGQGIRIPSPDYLKKVVKLCHRSNILVVFDEIKVGMGRMGHFCSFMAEQGLHPDVVTLSKSLGGGVRAISAMVTTKQIFKRAYGSRESCALHGSTFGGMGGACAAAIETLNLLYEGDFLDQVKSKGDIFIKKLENLQEKYPSQIKEVLGGGMLLGLRFHFPKFGLDKLDLSLTSSLLKTYDSVMIAALVRELFKEHDYLLHFTGSDPDILHITPPLISTHEDFDRFIAIMDNVLKGGLLNLLKKFIVSNAATILLRH
jgi:acetylornithine/succinyldiaminopimelate/putrescine aminotransferase